MNRAARRLRNRADLEREVDALTLARDSLLDVLNAVLMSQGGRLVIPAELVTASTRKPIHVTQKLDPARYVIELDGLESKPESKPSVVERLRKLGLKAV